MKFEKGDFLTFSSFRYLSLFIVEISIEVQIYEGAYFDKPSDVLQAGIWKSTTLETFSGKWLFSELSDENTWDLF